VRAGFWLKLIAGTVAAGIGVVIVFAVFGWVWYAWRLLGAFLALGAALLALGYLLDRRERRRRQRDLAEASPRAASAG